MKAVRRQCLGLHPIIPYIHSPEFIARLSPLCLSFTIHRHHNGANGCKTIFRNKTKREAAKKRTAYTTHDVRDLYVSSIVRDKEEINETEKKTKKISTIFFFLRSSLSFTTFLFLRNGKTCEWILLNARCIRPLKRCQFSNSKISDSDER